METVQLTIADTPYAASLRELLAQGGESQVVCVDVPDPALDGVIVVDLDALSRLPSPLPNPERVVLVTRNDPKHLSEAWNAGIRSVVFSGDSLSTAVLAIQAAALRVLKTDSGCAGCPDTSSRPAGGTVVVAGLSGLAGAAAPRLAPCKKGGLK